MPEYKYECVWKDARFSIISNIEIVIGHVIDMHGVSLEVVARYFSEDESVELHFQIKQ